MQYPYVAQDTDHRNAGYSPLIPITLQYTKEMNVYGLLDTGASVNVLPYSIGLQLGGVWDEQITPVRLTGNLANFEARVFLLSGKVGDFPPVRLAFAWTKTDNVPLILGQVNFFMEFDVCFHRSRLIIDVQPKP